jgi:molybdenum cofactor cytidylyltransferase
MIGAIILAAGSSRRFGDDKRKSLLSNGETLLAATIRKAAVSVSEILVILRSDDQAFADTLTHTLAASPTKRNNNENISFFRAPDSALGMAHSLANGISQVQDWQAALVMLGDMPFVETPTIQKILAAYTNNTEADTNPAPIVVPCHNGKFGHPVLFSRTYFKEIASLTGDRGARPVIDAHPKYLIKLNVDDKGVLLDVDRPADLR